MQLKSLLTVVPFMLTMFNSVASAASDDNLVINKIVKTDMRRLSEVVDANNFCVYLPPKNSKNRNIADMEWTAEPFCMGSTPFANKAKANPMPEGFILSAHYLVTDAFIQVTGQIDPAKANLNVTDEGGQMDIRAPNPSRCWGWKYYVNLIEPLGRTYCMRCCNDPKTCNRGISEKGCAHIIPGDYSGPLTVGGDDNKNGGGIVTTTTDKTTPASSGSGAASSTTPTTTPNTGNTGNAGNANKNPPAGNNNNNNTPAVASSSSSSASSASSTPTTVPDAGNASNNNNNGKTDTTGNNGDAKVSAQSVSGATHLTSSMTLFTILAIVLSFLSI
ncbi:unnamed protein product [Cunninghamella blakesleeana]